MEIILQFHAPADSPSQKGAPATHLDARLGRPQRRSKKLYFSI